MSYFQRFSKLCMTTCVLLLLSAIVKAQNSTDIGLIPNAPFANSNIDHINMATGNVVGTIPLVSYPQVGHLPALSFSAIFNTNAWTEQEACDSYSDECLAYYTLSYNPVTWSSDLGASIQSNLEGIKLDVNAYYTGSAICTNPIWPYLCDSPADLYSAQRDLTVIDPTGASHVLGYDATNPNWAHAVDGTGYSFYAVGASDPFNAQNYFNSISGSLYSPEGNTLQWNNATQSSTITDPLGNSMSSGYPVAGQRGYHDSVGRQFSDPVYGGSSVTALSRCPNLGLTSQALAYATEWDAPGQNGGTVAYIFCYTGIAFQPYFYKSTGSLTCDEQEQYWGTYDDDTVWAPSSIGQPSGYSEGFCNEWYSMTALQSIVLPNGTAWSFIYDAGTPTTDGNGYTEVTESYGTVNTVILPTGGTIQYGYSNLYPNALDDSYGTNSRLVTSRTISTNGNSSTTTYSYARPFNGNWTTTETAPDGSNTVHTLTGGYETKTQIYQGAVGSSLLQEVDTTYTSTNGASNFSFSPRATTTLVPSTVNTLASGSILSTLSYGYTSPYSTEGVNCVIDYYDEELSGTEYCSASNGPSALYLVQPTQQTVSDGTGNVLQAKSTTPKYTTSSVYKYANMLSLIASEQTSDSDGNIVAQTTYGYDEPGFVPSGTCSGSAAVCGDQTSINNWLNTTGQYLTMHASFDAHGMAVGQTDAKGNTTTMTYQCADSLPLTVTNALSQTTSYVYDCNTAHLDSLTDPNNQTTSYTYDTMQNLTSVTYPDNTTGSPSVSVNYNGYATPLDVVVTQLATPGPSVVHETKYDGLGRPVRSIISSDPAGADITDTAYDVNGRVYSVSNPYRNPSAVGDPPTGTTFYVYDALGRKTMATEPDGSVQRWCYNNVPMPGTGQVSCSANGTVQAGVWVDSSDEMGRHHQQVTNALGQLVAVMEPSPATDALAYETDYAYDLMGNLTSVYQKGNGSTDTPRIRAFSYDSLARLVGACNPETLPYAQTCSLTGNTSWGTQYTYDASGNVQTKTDARGVITHYGYDALNRLTGKSYSGAVGNTNAINIANSTLGTEYYYDQNTYQGLAIANGIGRRTGMNDAVGESAWSYDPLGRVSSFLRITQDILGPGNPQYGGPIPNAGSYHYNLAGQVASDWFGNPWTYDGAGRANGMGSSGYPWVSNVAYTPSGAIKSMNRYFDDGGTSTSTTAYNNRGQVTAIGAAFRGLYDSSVTPFLNLSYSYNSAPNNDGNIVAVANDINANRSQQFSYDYLNRLSGAWSCNSISTSTPCAHAGTLWGNTYGYDPFGNLTNKNAVSGVVNAESSPQVGTVPPSNQLPGYSYDAAGNMTSDGINTYAYDAEGRLATAGTAHYYYDGDGQRTIKDTGNGNPWYYFRDIAGMPIVEQDDEGDYLYVLSFGGQVIFRQDESGNAAYPFYDHLGSARVVLDMGGGVLADSDFYPFGGQIPATYSSAVEDPYQFTGKERDQESGLDYFGARYYASSMGRFSSPDPSGLMFADPTNPQSLNLYAYAWNNPLINIDPTGLECVWDNGSYDSNDDSSTGAGAVDGSGSHTGCSGKGGTWIDHSYFTSNNMADWSSQADSGLAGMTVVSATSANPIGKDYTEEETRSQLQTAYLEATNGRIGGLMNMYHNHQAYAKYDFGFNDHRNDTWTFCGQVMDADHMGNFIAGFDGAAYDSKYFWTTGGAGARNAEGAMEDAGVIYHMAGRTKAKNDRFDKTGMPDIMRGETVGKNWQGPNNSPCGH